MLDPYSELKPFFICMPVIPEVRAMIHSRAKAEMDSYFVCQT